MQPIVLRVPASLMCEVTADPAAWTIDQTIVWLQNLSCPADGLRALRGVWRNVPFFFVVFTFGQIANTTGTSQVLLR
ncbi:hypothetical protein BC830DRAFT_1088045 [Chytriomyces sp. MP71]|nr:hypothetical protein BC830DRAFT_1088045 [Chytriomyces sp. MP71]